MKLRLEIEMKLKDYKDVADIDGLTSEQIRQKVEEYLYDTMFEVCEEWVIHSNQPDMELIK